MMKWCGRVLEVNGDLLTVELTPAGHDGPELLADFSMAECGITATVGDILIVTPGKVTVRERRVWTKAELDEIMRRARIRHRRLMENVE